MATAASHRIGRDEVVWSFGPDMEPVLEVEPSSIVTLETNDCFTGQIQTEADLVTEIDFQRVNSATGPIAVRGAEPGDSLVVELLEVRPDERGFATLIPGIGQLFARASRFPRSRRHRTRFCRRAWRNAVRCRGAMVVPRQGRREPR